MLDRPIIFREVQAAANKLWRGTAAGPDTVTNAMLRNMSDRALRSLTEFMQACWSKSEIPGEWKKANLVIIPKLGKEICIENIRPISSTSCAGNFMEHVVQDRLGDSLEREGLYRDTMIGFRQQLSTNDVMLLLKEQMLDRKTLDARVIPGLDVSKAFDSIRYGAILERLSDLGVGLRTYEYVRNFLSGRTVNVSLSGEVRDGVELGSKGTPQGSVFSPTLFNVAIIELPAKLQGIEGIEHTLYADALTIWRTGSGSDGYITEQEAAVRGIKRNC